MAMQRMAHPDGELAVAKAAAQAGSAMVSCLGWQASSTALPPGSSRSCSWMSAWPPQVLIWPHTLRPGELAHAALQLPCMCAKPLHAPGQWHLLLVGALAAGGRPGHHRRQGQLLVPGWPRACPCLIALAANLRHIPTTAVVLAEPYRTLVVAQSITWVSSSQSTQELHSDVPGWQSFQDCSRAPKLTLMCPPSLTCCNNINLFKFFRQSLVGLEGCEVHAASLSALSPSRICSPALI